MAKFRYQHIKSSVEGKAPTAAQIKTAEIGVNDFAGNEKLFIKNSEGEVVDFPRGYSQAYIDENERVTAEALNDLNSRKLDASAYTPTDLSNYYTKDETSGKTEIQNALDEKADTATTYTKTEVDARDLWVSGTGENAIVQKGGNNTASGKLSVAMGSGTTASGDYSVAEGVNTTASGNSSHAEGVGTTASGQSSHAEGKYTIASGQSSHAEGIGTKANGESSHAEGYYTITLNNSEHASGRYNVSSSGSSTFGDSGNTLFSVGNGTNDARHNAFEIRQNGDIYLSDGTKLQDAIDITIDQVIDSGTSASTDAVSTSAVYGFVTSYTPSITVDQDFSNTASTNPISTKAVYSAVTDNELVWTNAYVALSSITSAHTADTSIHITSADRTKLDSITGNVGTMAYEDKTSYSSATEVNTAFAGKANTATTYTKTEVDARDLWVSGTGENAIVQKGGNNTASGTSSHAEGQGTKAGGESSHSEGQDTVANGKRSHAEGYNTSATTNASHAEGVGTLASGPISHAEGQATVADGSNSHAEGLLTAASGYASHAEGFYTRAFGQYSHAEGDSAKASGYSSHAEGANTIANNTAEHASGQYNVSSSSSETFGHSGNTLFSVGNGADANSRHNAFEIRQNGDIYITSGNTDIKLQDSLGGTIDQTIDSTTSASTNAVSTSAVYTQMDGLKLKKITQSDYDQLQTKDPNTLYIISD